MNGKVKSMCRPRCSLCVRSKPTLAEMKKMSTPMKCLKTQTAEGKKSLSIRSSKKCYTDKVKRESSLRKKAIFHPPFSFRQGEASTRLLTTTDLVLGNRMGREAYLTFCLIKFSNPFFRTNLECKQGRKGPISDPAKKNLTLAVIEIAQLQTGGGPGLPFLLE